MLTIEWIAAVVIIFLIVARTLQSLQQKKPGITYPYTLRPSLLTPTELHFYQTLRQATDKAICSKVRIADILDSPRNDKASFWRVSQKHVDFLLCDPQTMKPLLAVELDDRTHDQPDRQARDQFVDKAYAAASLPILHIKPQQRYDTEAIRTQVIQILG